MRRIVNIEDLRTRARRRLPRPIFDYVDGGAEDEQALRANRRAFERYALDPRVMVDVGQRDQSVTVLGETLRLPVIIAPTGWSGSLWPRGEVMGARAAGKAGTIFTLSTMSTCSIEEVAAAAAGPLWFQLYMWRDREITRSLVERARLAGYRALMVTADVPVLGQRERDARSGLTLPPRITSTTIIGMLRRPMWLVRFATSPRVTFGNLRDAPGVEKGPMSRLTFVAQQFSPTLSWADLDWLRSLWAGPILVKGIMSRHDALLAVERGAQGIVVSNHGGRQLDHAPGTLDVLPEIVDAVAGRAEVILDGGIRRGTDVVKAVSLGARATMIGRAYNYGLGAMGEAGAARALAILRAEIDRCLALMGRPKLADLDRSAVRLMESRRQPGQDA